MSGQTEYILSYFLHGIVLCPGIYMSVIKPSICFSKRVISAKWRNKLLIQNINLTVYRKNACCLGLLVFLETWVVAPFWHCGYPWFFPRVVTTMISKQFVNMGIIIYLKLVSAIFYQIFIFSPYDSPLKTMKNVSYFIQKALLVLEIFKVLHFLHFLFTLSRSKRTNEME